MNVRYILNIEGKILIILSFFMLTNFPWIFYFNEQEVLYPMMYSFLIPAIIGGTILFITRHVDGSFKLKEAYFLVSAAWLTMGIVGSLPFYMTGSIPSIVNAIFESISGFTTTGSSILTDIESWWKWPWNR